MNKSIIIQIAVLTVIVLLTAGGCSSSPSVSVTIDELDIAIRDASDYLNDNIPRGSKIVILNIQSNSPNLSDYIIDELIANAVNDRVFSVVDRQQLDAIRAEQNFQLSGEVADNEALEIGRFLGAQIIISGAVNRLGTGYRIRIRALDVQTAQVQGQYNRNIAASLMIISIIEGDTSAITMADGKITQVPSITATNLTKLETPAITPVASAQSLFKIGDTGPAGGLIFYDKGNNAGGWRYLEAAPADAEFQARWSIHYTADVNTQTMIGSGKRNTQLIVELFKQTPGQWDTVAQQTDELVYNGFNDWFLPSKAELDQMYGNLKRKNLGDFKDGWYWSSSMSSTSQAHCQDFSTGLMDYTDTINFTSRNYPRGFNVRPIRAF